jgi:hypothetical protein
MAHIFAQNEVQGSAFAVNLSIEENMTPNSFLEGILIDNRPQRQKLLSFTTDYDLRSKPALIWQCHPVKPGEIDVSVTALRETLEAGADGEADNGWWYGFKAGKRSTPVLDGLAAYPSSDDHGWIAEVHTDGHIIAGLWSFPELGNPDMPARLVVSDFHTQAFLDFGSLANRLNALLPSAYPCQVTCTLVNASQIHFHREHSRLVPMKANREHLQWRVREVKTREELLKTLELMADELPRAFGHWPRPKPGQTA